MSDKSLPIQKFTIPKPDFFSFDECLWFLDRGYDDCMHQIQGRTISKTIPTAGPPLSFSISDASDELIINASSTNPDSVTAIKSHVRQWFDLDRDLGAFYSLTDQLIQNLQTRYWGLRLIGIPDLFEALCWSIIGQQINLKFAYRLKRRFVEQFGRAVDTDNLRLWLFPAPEVIAELSIATLQELQFSRQKADYITHLAKEMTTGKVSSESFLSEPNTVTMSARLQQLRGVGEWTANYVLMKTFGRTDSVPYGDTGLINGIQQLLQLDTKPKREKIQQVLSHAPGWEGYLVFFIWRSLADPPTRISSS